MDTHAEKLKARLRDYRTAEGPGALAEILLDTARNLGDGHDMVEDLGLGAVVLVVAEILTGSHDDGSSLRSLMSFFRDSLYEELYSEK